MFGDTKVRLSARIIPDPGKLLAEIDALFLTLPRTPEVAQAMLLTKNLVIDSTRVEYVQVVVDRENLERFSGKDHMDYVNEKLRQALSERLIAVVNPVSTQFPDEE